ncbi:MAG: flagellar basal body rod C-terminal domain-containing protein [Verrucomicrobiota bacterium]
MQPSDPDALLYDGSGWRLPEGGGVDLENLEEPLLQPGFLEEGNFSSLTSMVSFIQISRAFEANQKAIHTADEMIDRTIRAYQ